MNGGIDRHAAASEDVQKTQRCRIPEGERMLVELGTDAYTGGPQETAVYALCLYHDGFGNRCGQCLHYAQAGRGDRRP